ncbi:MAG: T9SS type A sorting domain-containing protein [Bacteroidetes bacterium]|nr:T9SS type A sorting domain-containing protein [Bacteroidota bacterium]
MRKKWLPCPAANDYGFTIGTGSPTTPLVGFVYTPNTVYNMAFIINLIATTNPFYGFQIVALDAANAKAGTMQVTNAATTQINTSVATGTRQYMGHHTANSTHNWSYKWTAPAAGTGPVVFYYSYNVCNASSATPNSAQGTIYKGVIPIQEAPSGIEDMTSKVSDLNVFPNPISNELSVSFDLKETEMVSSQLFSLDGKEVNRLMNEKVSEGNFVRTFNTNDLPSGIYLMKLNVGGASVIRKIVKQ